LSIVGGNSRNLLNVLCFFKVFGKGYAALGKNVSTKWIEKQRAKKMFCILGVKSNDPIESFYN